MTRFHGRTSHFSPNAMEARSLPGTIRHAAKLGCRLFQQNASKAIIGGGDAARSSRSCAAARSRAFQATRRRRRRVLGRSAALPEVTAVRDKYRQ